MTPWAEWLKPVALAVVLIVGYIAGWQTASWRLGKQIAETEAAASSARAEAFRWVAAEQDRSARAMAEADRAATGRIANVEKESDRLAGCIAAGNGCGLRVKVVRTAAKCGTVPETGAAASMGDRSGEWADLSADSGLAVLAARKQLAKRDEALAVCMSRHQ